MNNTKHKIRIFALMNFGVGLIYVLVILLIFEVIFNSTPLLDFLSFIFFVLSSYLIVATVKMDIDAYKYGIDKSIKLKSDKLDSLDTKGDKK